MSSTRADYWLVRSELVWSRWNVPVRDAGDVRHNVDALGAWVEGRYRITPRIVVSGRADRLGVFAPRGRPEPGADLGRQRLRASRPTPATTFSATSWRGSPCSTTIATAVASTTHVLFRPGRLLVLMLDPAARLRSIARGASPLSAVAAGTPASRQRIAIRRNGTIRGRVELRQPPADLAPRPHVGDVSMPRAHDPTDRRRSVVYLETAPRAAFDQRDEPRAKLDQRNEAFVPHVLAIVAGTTVDFPNNDTTYHNVFSLSTTQAVRSRPLRRRPVEVRQVRSPGHRPRLLRHPLAHERLHPGLRAPPLRRHRR